MTSSLLELIFKTSKQGQGGKKAAAELKELKGTVGELSQGLTGMNLAGLSALGAVTAIGAFVGDSVKQWSDYAESVGKAADLSGIGAEEMSRLMQAADDARVPVESLTTAFAIAQKNGFLPTISNLATLADRLKGMDQLKVAAEMTKIFGKNWKEIYPLLKDGGQAIRDGTSAIADNMVVTDKAVKANRDYIAAVDNLDDAWTGVKNQLAQTVIPVLTDVLTQINDTNLAIERQHYLLENNRPAMSHQQMMEWVASADRRAGLALLENSNYMDRWDQAVTSANNGSDFIASMGKMTEANSGFTSSSMSAASAVRDNLSVAISQQGAIQTQLADATKDLAEKQKAFGQSLGSDVAGALKSAGVEGTNLVGALGTVDEVMGTNLKTAELQTQAVEALVKSYDPRHPEEFKTKLQELKEQFSPLDESIKTSTKNIESLNSQLQIAAIAVDALNGSTIWIETKYTTSGTPPDHQGSTGTRSTTPREGANGLDIMVPAGYPTDSYPILARSGERVIIQTPEQQRGGWGASVTIQQVILANKMDLQEFKVMLNQALRR